MFQSNVSFLDCKFDYLIGKMENLRTLISGFLGLVILVGCSLMQSYILGFYSSIFPQEVFF